MTGGAFKYRPFTFDRSFDEAEIERVRQAAMEEQAALEEAERLAELERNPPPPTFSEEELEAARASAFQDGSAQGTDQAMASIESQTMAALQTITGQLAVLHDRQALANESNSAQLAKITGDIIERLLPHYVKAHGADEIIALVRECLEPLEDGGRVIIKVPSESRDILEEKLNLAAQESGFEGKLVVKADPALGPSDVKVDWGHGGTERKLQETWDAIKEAIDHCLSHTSAEIAAAEIQSEPAEPEGDEVPEAIPPQEEATQQAEALPTDIPPGEPAQPADPSAEMADPVIEESQVSEDTADMGPEPADAAPTGAGPDEDVKE